MKRVLVMVVVILSIGFLQAEVAKKIAVDKVAKKTVVDKAARKTKADFFKGVKNYKECKKACENYVEDLNERGLLGLDDTVADAYQRAVDENCYMYWDECKKAKREYKQCKRNCANKIKKLVKDGILDGTEEAEQYTICVDKECSAQYGKDCCKEKCSDKSCDVGCALKFKE